MSKAKASFDVSKYTIGNDPKKTTVKIEETGDEFEVTVKPLSWAKRNQILSKSLTWDSSGTTSFDGDTYVRSCLREMLLDAPWGRTTETFLISIDARLGAALEILVPQAFSGENADTLTPDQVKKELSPSSQA
jgi:hypothetical protein|tara:strand:+ start:690 stop:1088 length:399 start_codon:yes stop_codon:yes gene_type:complete